MGSNWLKNTIRGVLISALEDLTATDTHRSEVTATGFGTTKRGIDTNQLASVDAQQFEVTGTTTALLALDYVDDFEWTSAVTRVAGGCILNSIQCTVTEDKTPSLAIYIFDEDPTINSAQAASLELAAGESEKCIATVFVRIGSYEVISATTNIQRTAFIGQLGIPLKSAAADTSFYVVVQVLDDITFTATDSINLRFGTIQT